MSVKKDPSGRRSVEVAVEVPGTPEEVWQAIATGPGISSWFVPATMEEQDGKPVSMTLTFGPGMDSRSTVTEWDPPRRFAAENPGWTPGSPPVATEWIVEARSGGTCTVRVVHSLFASTDEWDSQIEGTEHGWPTWFRILRLVLTHFRGQPGSSIRLAGNGTGSEAEAWSALTGALGLAGVAVNERWTKPAGLPPVAGRVEHAEKARDHTYEILRLDEPAPGIAFLMAHCMFGPAPHLELHLFLFGDRAAAVAVRDEPAWQAWMKEKFPAVGNADAGT
jgi:uncharacterized protein YndB with AHSA1/START domain